MIPTYNCARYLRKTLESVLAQDPGSEVMQIMVVDNCSTQDDPEAVVKELGGGRVEFYRQSENIGSTRNFNSCLQLARGSLIHLLHGDDYVLEGFYQKMQSLFALHSKIGAAFCRSQYVEENENLVSFSNLEMPESGVLPDVWLEKIAISCCVDASAVVVRREVYENLGGFALGLLGNDDWEMWVRIATKYPIGYETTPLAAYRQNPGSIASSMLNSGSVLEELHKAIGVIHSYLPSEIKQRVFPKAMQNQALNGLSSAQLLVDRGQWQQAIKIIRLACWMSPSCPVIRWTMRIFLVDGSRFLFQSLFKKFPKSPLLEEDR
jgi:glycosyltransferase involved in cell wall biosynthesis